MEYFVISAKFVPLKYYTLSSQLQRLASFSVGCSGRRILSPGQINITLTLSWVWWGRCEKNYLPKEEGREGGEKKRAQRARRARGSNPGPAAC